MLWLAGQEAKPADVQEKEAAAAVKVQAVARGHATRQGTGGSIPRAMGGCRGSGGPAQLAMRAAAAQRKEERKAAQALLGDFVLDTTPQALTPAQQLAKILKRDGARVMDLFKKWDVDQSGKVERQEFRKAIGLLGLTGVPRDDVDDLFDEWGGGDGSIDFKELVSRGSPDPDPNPNPNLSPNPNPNPSPNPKTLTRRPRCGTSRLRSTGPPPRRRPWSEWAREAAGWSRQGIPLPTTRAVGGRTQPWATRTGLGRCQQLVS